MKREEQNKGTELREATTDPNPKPYGLGTMSILTEARGKVIQCHVSGHI